MEKTLIVIVLGIVGTLAITALIWGVVAFLAWDVLWFTVMPYLVIRIWVLTLFIAMLYIGGTEY